MHAVTVTEAKQHLDELAKSLPSSRSEAVSVHVEGGEQTKEWQPEQQDRLVKGRPFSPARQRDVDRKEHHLTTFARFPSMRR